MSGLNVQNSSLRPLGALEEFFYQLKQTESPTVVALAELDLQVPPSRWNDAIEKVNSSRSLLRAEIQQDGLARPAYRLRDNQAAPAVRILSPEEDIPSFVRSELRTSFAANAKYLWRVAVGVVGGKSAVVVAADHTLIDGRGVAMLLQDLLTAVSGKPLETRSDFPPSHDQLVGLEPNNTYQRRQDNPPAVQSDGDANPGELSVDQVSMEAHEVSAVIAKAKRKGTTFHGALTAALLLSGADLSKSWKTQDITYVSPIDNRPLLRMPDYFGLLISFAFGQFNAQLREGFWDIARRVRTEVVSEQALEHSKATLQHLQDVMKEHIRPQEAFSLLPPWDLMVTNYGVLPIKTQYDGFALKRFIPHVISRPFGQTVSAATVDGVLFMSNVSYSPIPNLLPHAKNILMSQAAED